MGRIGKALLAVALILGAAPVAVAGGGSHSEDVAETMAAVKNTATAEESYRTDHRKYTTHIGRLKRQDGLRYDEQSIDLFASWADENGYCIEARHVDVVKARHYDSTQGNPRIGRCPEHRRARGNWRDQVAGTLKNAATAEESYATNGDGYTTDESVLVAEGFKAESREVNFDIVSADDVGYCMEATHDRLRATWFYDSDMGLPKKGRCEA
ncbi:MAG: hypothetical protein QOG54_2687 [Actinomycetota bacterium]|jgi:hypothetical protein|nr:hypothetical protein [Actinomycetota bacterium]